MKKISGVSLAQITSCIFIARSIAAFEYESMFRMVSYSHYRESGHFTC